VVSRGVPLADVSRMILYLMPSFLVFTIPMAFLLAVLLAFGRLSADNEITVIKAGGVSLVQIMPPVLACALVAAIFTLATSLIGVPWGNSAFKELSFRVFKQNISATIREKIFWDEIPGMILYTEHYDDQRHTLQGVIIHDGRNPGRPMTIFAKDGVVNGGSESQAMRLSLKSGSIHAAGKGDEYRLVTFGEYIMTVGAQGGAAGIGRNEQDMGVSELRGQIADQATPLLTRLKMLSELHGRYAFPFASVVFAFLAVPLGIQNRRSGKSAGFAISIGILLAYYLMLSLCKTLAEKGTIPPFVALWLPNMIFLGLGWYLLRMASLERTLPIPDFSRMIAAVKGWRR
ncbi:MAG: LPS export ABC transporter permease LptF, partial [Deltaproteobacteria bacterium]|nr:LPS export ABC transporter permease LptF [Deltaproteobacteria bacterium]